MSRGSFLSCFVWLASVFIACSAQTGFDAEDATQAPKQSSTALGFVVLYCGEAIQKHGVFAEWKCKGDNEYRVLDPSKRMIKGLALCQNHTAEKVRIGSHTACLGSRIQQIVVDIRPPPMRP